MPPLTEAGLADLLSVVRGQAGLVGPGLTSYPPATDDENQQRIHAGMLELERRWLVRRVNAPDDGFVVWAPVAE